MIGRTSTKRQIRPQPAREEKLAGSMVRTILYPRPDLSETHDIREFDTAQRVEREGFRPEEDSVEEEVVRIP